MHNSRTNDGLFSAISFGNAQEFNFISALVTTESTLSLKAIGMPLAPNNGKSN